MNFMKFRNWINEGARELAQTYKSTLGGVRQDPTHHPEGDVLAHVRLVRKAIPQAIVELQNLQQTHPILGPALADLNFALTPEEKQIVILSAWLHDVGKVTATTTNDQGKIQSLQHQEPHHYEPQLEKLRSIAPPETVQLFSRNEQLIRFLIERHMDLAIQGFSRSFLTSYFANGKFRNVPEVKLLFVLCWADKMGRTPEAIAGVLEKTVMALTDSVQRAHARERNIANHPQPFQGDPRQFAAMLQTRDMARNQRVQAMRGKFPQITDDELSQYFPENQQDKLMIIMRGVSGSGKSTKARSLAGTSGVVLSTDDYFGDYKTLDFSQLPKAHLWNQGRVKEALQKGISPVIVDNTNIEVWEPKPYVLLANQFGYRVEFQEPDSDIWQRIKAAATSGDKQMLDQLAAELGQRNQHGVPASSIAKTIGMYAPITIQQVLASKMPWERDPE